MTERERYLRERDAATRRAMLDWPKRRAKIRKARADLVAYVREEYGRGDS